MGGRPSSGRIKKRKQTRISMIRGARTSSSNRNIASVFEQFKDEHGTSFCYYRPRSRHILTGSRFYSLRFVEDKIGPEGLESLFAKLDVSPVAIEALIFAWKLDGKVPFEFTRRQFVEGCLALGCDSLEQLKAVIRA